MRTFYLTISLTMPDDSSVAECEEWGASLISLLEENHYGGRKGQAHPYKPIVIGATEYFCGEVRGGGKASTHEKA